VIPCHPRTISLVALAATCFAVSCHRGKKTSHDDAGPLPSTVAPEPSPSLQVLYLPDGGDQVFGDGRRPLPDMPTPFPSAALNPARSCPPEMVDVKGQFCIDRWEAILVDKRSGRELSPYYSPIPDRAKKAFAYWQGERSNQGSVQARSLEVPQLEPWQLGRGVEPMAVSKPGRVPSGYVDGNSAAHACERAGKRLCRADEWTAACRGQQDRPFPYGDGYEQGACNVFRETHPGVILHGDASTGHLDPRLNLVQGAQGPLLRKTGTSPRCASTWGNDRVYDMVGNLDEWVEDGEGAFLGGFYARATRAGCESRISVHPKPYADYSLGVRCCK
jgi:formylglycine-generating enzyme